MRNGFYGETGKCSQQGCGRTVKVRMPRHGDTAERITAWHKNATTGEPCRAFVDVADVQQPDSATSSSGVPDGA